LDGEIVHPATGVNLLGDAVAGIPPHAVMQYGNNIAYRQVTGQDDDVIIFQENREPMQFRYQDQALLPAKLDEALLAVALSHVEWPRLAYKHRWYRLPGLPDPAAVAERTVSTADAPE